MYTIYSIYTLYTLYTHYLFYIHYTHTIYSIYTLYTLYRSHKSVTRYLLLITNINVKSMDKAMRVMMKRIIVSNPQIMCC